MIKGLEITCDECGASEDALDMQNVKELLDEYYTTSSDGKHKCEGCVFLDEEEEEEEIN